MDVSVIIPTYGKPVYLKNAIKSVLSQSNIELELIIVDDNNPETEARKSTEELVRKCCNADARVIYLKHDHNKNGAAARNTGFAIARGKYISLLDSDDEYMPNRLQKCVEAMEGATTDVAGVYTGCEFRRGGKLYHIEKTVPSGNFLKETLACTFKFCTGSNIFIRKSVVDELCGFDEAFIRHQDYEFLARVFERGYKLMAVSEPLVIKNNENVNLPDVRKMIGVKQQYLEKFKDTISRLDARSQAYIYHTQCVLIAEAALRSGEKKISKEYYSRSQKYSRLTIQEAARKIAFTSLNLLH